MPFPVMCCCNLLDQVISYSTLLSPWLKYLFFIHLAVIHILTQQPPYEGLGMRLVYSYASCSFWHAFILLSSLLFDIKFIHEYDKIDPNLIFLSHLFR